MKFSKRASAGLADGMLFTPANTGERESLPLSTIPAEQTRNTNESTD